MKKTILLLTLPLLIACQQNHDDQHLGYATVNFTLNGFAPILTRSSLAESDMTNLWLFDFVGDECVQSIHWSSTDPAFSSPSAPLSYGTHHICFVTSRGDDPAIDASTRVLSWSVPRDTFWGDVSLNVGASSTGSSVSVTLDRVATKLRILITDEVPASIVSVSATPSEWYYGLNYETGAAAGELLKERVVYVPSSYIGTSGLLAINFFGLSDSGEWMTDVLVKAVGADNAILGQTTISDAPFVRNRSTEYSGPLFGSSSAWTILLNDIWESPYNGTW